MLFLLCGLSCLQLVKWDAIMSCYQTFSELKQTSKLVHWIVSKGIRGGKWGNLCCSSGVAKAEPARAKPSLCPAAEIKKDSDALIEQSNILIKQSVGQVVPCQLNESGYTTALSAME